jgi:chaperonin cofactor prefoldin
VSQLKLVVNNKPQWDAMLEEIYFRISFAHKQMEQYDDPAEIYRLQGEIRALRSLTKLRDKINND